MELINSLLVLGLIIGSAVFLIVVFSRKALKH